MKKIFGKSHEDEREKQDQPVAYAAEEQVASPANIMEAPLTNPTDVIPEQTSAPSESTLQEPANNEENLVETLKQLSEQVGTLTNEKSQMITMEESMSTKIAEEIETKKRNIEQLKIEIPKLKQKCEYLANVLKIPVYR